MVDDVLQSNLEINLPNINSLLIGKILKFIQFVGDIFFSPHVHIVQCSHLFCFLPMGNLYSTDVM